MTAKSNRKPENKGTIPAGGEGQDVSSPPETATDAPASEPSISPEGGAAGSSEAVVPEPPPPSEPEAKLEKSAGKATKAKPAHNTESAREAAPSQPGWLKRAALWLGTDLDGK
ncbi:MAG: hypothetical protein QM723_07075 [Myxococcaceae bacterium]